ncbi:MAG: hypothetical protein HN368_04000 [Spirochaetales bacterium]|nr:hypothetical protein [Spirochaetales bacterium]
MNLLPYHYLYSGKAEQLSVFPTDFGKLDDQLISSLTAELNQNGIRVEVPSAPLRRRDITEKNPLPPESEYLHEPPPMNERMRVLSERRDRIDREHGRVIFAVSSDIALGQASSRPAAISSDGLVALGDQSTVVRIEAPFPGILPSGDTGILYNPMNKALDYKALLDASPAEVYPGETIVGEFHWDLMELRPRLFPESAELEMISDEASALGAGGYPVTHTCADLSLGIDMGWGGIHGKIVSSLENHRREGRNERADYLESQKVVCEAIIRFIEKHAAIAHNLSLEAPDPEQCKRYQTVALACANITRKPPGTFHEGVQWLWFFMMAERMDCGGNGYGRLDQYLFPLYEKDVAAGVLTKTGARELIAELFLKNGTFFSLGGRLRDGSDATNELSWICLEAYDMIGGMMMLGAMWHGDVDAKFIKYAGAIMARHGNGSVALVNQDVLRDSEIRYGVAPQDAWNTAYSGCFWYCVPGKEWCSHDTLSLSGIKCFMNALEEGFSAGINSMSDVWTLYDKHVDLAVQALKRQTDWQFEQIPMVWPEFITSLLTHGCIESGRDISDCGVSYNTSVVQFSGLANIADSMIAIQKCVFEDQLFDIETLRKALSVNFEGFERIRQNLLNCPKFGDDEEEVTSVAARITDHYRSALSRYRNCKGFRYRPAFFSWAGHAYAETILGATPDGRRKEQPIAQGANPSHHQGAKGVTAMANSVSVADFSKNAGGQLQLEFDPSFLDVSDPGLIVSGLAKGYFEKDGPLVLLNVVSAETLRNAVESPEEYGHIVVRVTGFAAHFVQLDRKIQEEIISRTRYTATT